MNNNFNTPPDPAAFFKKIYKSGIIFPATAFFFVMILLLVTCRFGEISGEQVGVLLNKLNGEMEVITQSGVKIYNGILSEFYTLDRTRTTLNMTERPNEGDRKGKDNLKIKTIDGSDVHIDIKAEYEIIPEKADEVLKTSGPGNAFKEKWMRDYVRSTCRNFLGELTTEEFYNASKRFSKVAAAKREINKRLNEYGLRLTTLTNSSTPIFYKEYEEAIHAKKNEDQAVLEERSKANAAEQLKLQKIVTEKNITNVTIKKFEGDMEKIIIRAKADAEKAKKEADAYFNRVTIEAEAKYYQMEKTAKAIIAKKSAEAKGIEEMKKALEGEGGKNMVMLEYAKNLKTISINGQPVQVSGDMERFQHNKGALLPQK
jgi:regulator of protease activity HflC (stomatin/prohibitin superfamily)